MKQIMLDLETMGTKPGCAIVSIGAVKFDLMTGAAEEQFYTAVSLKSCMNAGLMPEASTIMWWLQQTDQAREKLQDPSAMHLHDALTEFSKFCTPGHAIWGNSASFDCGILQAAYECVKLQTPWEFYNERCFRTMKSMFPLNHPKKDATKAHDPIYDCHYQISVLNHIWQQIKGRNVVTY
jgi:hypothetical protein